MKKIIFYVLLIFLLLFVSCGSPLDFFHHTQGEVWQSDFDKEVIAEINFLRGSPKAYAKKVVEPNIKAANCPPESDFDFEVAPAEGKNGNDNCYKMYSAKKYLNGERVPVPGDNKFVKIPESLSLVRQSLPLSLAMRDKATDPFRTDGRPHHSSIDQSEYASFYGKNASLKNENASGSGVPRSTDGFEKFNARSLIWSWVKDAGDANDVLGHRLNLLGGAKHNVIGFGYNPFDSAQTIQRAVLQIGFIENEDFDNSTTTPMAIHPKVFWTVIRVVDGHIIAVKRNQGTQKVPAEAL